ncbi:selenocysteine-specific translation elongation factor [Orenia marismortui]|uniref:selenocysteine-specific translation elongation factor n=1 Tax=Orenia marismortui TaxID=46469 RepID=UPI00036554C7|nr:selenocysteine-specific translation elongation factor [Orenia marismortui]
MKKNLIIGTAGHIDHGKTTLIKALTGIDTDRLVAEKKRGISIELGFSYLELSNGLQLGIIDVPGHEKFIKNMLAGAGGVDLALLVVAADEGFMPQTEEHLAILELLNVEEGIIVVTKSDLVEREWLELVIEEIKEEIKGSFLEGAPILSISAVAGQGIDSLKSELERMTAKITNKDQRGNVYLPIDRVFSLSGHGTIITGTLLKGSIKVGEKLRVYPQGIESRVRSIEVHNQEVEVAYPGQRVGINLAGVDREQLNRGDVLATIDTLVATKYLHAQLKLLSTAPLVLESGQRIRLHLGAKEVLGRVHLLNQKELYPGETALVEFKLEEEVVANSKEPYILRRYSPMTTIGGGEILDNNPTLHRKFDDKVIETLEIKAKGSLEERIELELKLSDHRPLLVSDLIKKTSLDARRLNSTLLDLKARRQAIELKTGIESTWLHIEHYLSLKAETLKNLEEYHQQYPLRLGMAKEELRTKLALKLSVNEYDLILEELEQKEKIEVNSSLVKLREFKVKLNLKEEKIKEEIIKTYQEAGFIPPKIEEVIDRFREESLVKDIVDLLVEREELIKINSEIYMHDQYFRRSEKILKDYLEEEGEIELREFRDLLKSSRKYTQLLLEYFDQQGLTKRIGDQRILL